MKKKACLMHVFAYYNEETILVDEEKLVHVVYLDFKMAFYTGKHSPREAVEVPSR